MLPVATYAVIAIAHPLRGERDVFFSGRNCTVEDAIATAAERADVPLATFHGAIVVVGDRIVPADEWATTFPPLGQTLVIRATAGDPVSIISLVTSVAAAAAPGVATSLGFTFFTAGSWAAIGLSATVSIIGALVAFAMTPTPRQQNTRSDPVSAVHSIQGVRNEARPYQPIPRHFGRREWYYPPLAVQPYTEINYSNDQYLRVVFCIGEGPLQISDMRIGNTLLTDYEGVEYQVRQGYPSDLPITLFPRQVREEGISIELKQVNGYHQRTTSVDSDECALDVIFPNGLGRKTNRGKLFQVNVQFQVDYKLSSSSTWLQAPLDGDQTSIKLYGGGLFEVQAAAMSAVRRTARIVFPARGTYDVRIKRVTIDDQSDTEGKDQSVTAEASFWSALRSMRNEHPIETTGLALVALRIKATDQLSGVIDQFSCTVEAIVPQWNGSAWVEGVSRSPAWAFAEVLRGNSNARPLADERINLAKLLAWDASCTAGGWTFDAVLEQQSSVWEVLGDIAATANAAVTTGNGIYSVIVDEARSTPVQLFTPRNSWGFELVRTVARRPHALRVRFPNVLTKHQFDELYCYEDGYDVSNASVFEGLDLPYTTDATQAWKRARRAIFSARLRPEIVSLMVDAEHLVAERGDLVYLVHDVPLWGTGAARIKALTVAGADITDVELDAPIALEALTDYSLLIRTADDNYITAAVDQVLVAGEYSAFTLTTPVPVADGAAVDDLVAVGTPVPMLIRSIEPQDDDAARVTMVAYAPEVFDADTGPVPEFDPQITLPPTINRPAPPAPVFQSVVSDEAVLIRASDGTLTSRMVVTINVPQDAGKLPAQVVRLRWRPTGSTQDWEYVNGLPSNSAPVTLLPVQDGDAYDIQAQSIAAAGATSSWSATQHTVVGKTGKPTDVERLYLVGTTVTWPYPDAPVDFWGFHARANYGTSTEWASGRPLHAGMLTTASIDISSLHGDQVIMVKAVDTSGNESENAAVLALELGAVRTSNVLDTQSEAPGWAGTITAGTVSGGVLEADADSNSVFWPADDAPFWPADAAPFWPSVTYQAMTYIATWTPDAGWLGDALLKVDITATGNYTVDYRIVTSPPFWPADGDPFWPADGDPFWPDETVSEWVPWPGELGPFSTAADSYQARVTFEAGATQGQLAAMDLIVDAPDVVELFSNVALAVTTGTRLTLTKTYRAIDYVDATPVKDGGTAVTARVVDYQANPGANGGPLLEALSTAGAVVAGTANVRVKGH